jgi:hypothetical protein
MVRSLSSDTCVCIGWHVCYIYIYIYIYTHTHIYIYTHTYIIQPGSTGVWGLVIVVKLCLTKPVAQISYEKSE